VTNILYALVGCLLGTLIGVLPGIGPVATIAMLLPTTYALPPVSALIMLAGIYYGAQYGGSTTAILVNLPGESSSVVTALDGYQMARQGRAGAALGMAAIGSFIAGSFSTLLVAAFAPPLSEAALKFGPADYFSLMVLGLIAAVVLAHGSVVKAIAMIVLGIVLGLVGTDVNSGVARYSFDTPELTDGIGFVAVAMGMFGIGEILINLEKGEAREIFTAKVGKLLPTARTSRILRVQLLAARCSARCSAFCLVAVRCSLRSRRIRSRRKWPAPTPSRLRQGQHRGVAAPESANNARADLLHPAADAGHSAERRDGADGGRDDHPQHPAGSAGHDRQPGCSGA
jgi:TctA family transporter